MKKLTLFTLLFCSVIMAITEVSAHYPYYDDYYDDGDYYDDYDRRARNFAVEYEKKKFNEFGKGGEYEHYKDDGKGGDGVPYGGFKRQRPRSRALEYEKKKFNEGGRGNQYEHYRDDGRGSNGRKSGAVEYEKSKFNEGGRGGEYEHYRDDGQGRGGGGGGGGNRGQVPTFSPARRNNRPKSRALEYERKKFNEGGRGGEYEHYRDDNRR